MIPRRPFALVSAFLLALGSTSTLEAQVVYKSDFESDDGGLTIQFGTDWEHGTPTSGPGSAHSGTKCWGTNLSGLTVDSTNYLQTPVLDLSAYAGADGAVVTWWQHVDEVPYHYAFASAFSSLGGQTIFAHHRAFASTDLSHDGWRHVRCVLGPEALASDLQLTIGLRGAGTEGLFVDDLQVEVLHATMISGEDFESGDGGFVSLGSWGRGAPTGCPFPIVPSSGAFCWGLVPNGCGYPVSANDVLLAPVVDLSPYANRRAAYLTWNRWAGMEFLADVVHHEVSFDGGVSWELATGSQGGASGPSWTFIGYGIAFDPSVTPSVQLRFRLTTDSFETEYGMWIDDFTVSVPEVVPGSGTNPTGSLYVSSGQFQAGTTVDLSVDDPGASMAPGSLVLLALARAGNPALPDGLPLPNWGMQAPGASGDLLVDPGKLLPLRAGPAWSPGSPSVISVNLPNSPGIVGKEFFLQGVLVDGSGPSLRFGLTNGLFEKVVQ